MIGGGVLRMTNIPCPECEGTGIDPVCTCYEDDTSICCGCWYCDGTGEIADNLDED